MKDVISRSIEIIEKYQSSSGAYVACPNFSTYNYCWLRDGSFIANSMDISGRYESSERFFQWVNQVISGQESKIKKLLEKISKKEPLSNSDFLPTRYALSGKETLDEWPNFQIDGYGTWLWALCEHITLTGRNELIAKYDNSIKLTIEYLLNVWSFPNYDCWEENGDKLHPSTLACIYGGLKSISEFVQDERISKTLESIKSTLLEKCLYDGCLSKYEGSTSVDGSLLWVTIPFDIIDVHDEIVTNTVKKIEEKLYHKGGVHRYPEDTYYGGGEWLLLSCWLGLYYVETDQQDKIKEILSWIELQANENGELPEQSLAHVNNKDYINKWELTWGKVATPLLWSHAMYLILLDKLSKQKLLL